MHSQHTHHDAVVDGGGQQADPQLGEAPGSPAYYGLSNHTHADAPAGAVPGIEEEEHESLPVSPVGQPPGCAAYYGSATRSTYPAAAAGARAHAMPARLAAIGEPPGSPAYYGKARADAATDTATNTAADTGAPVAVGDAPGSPAYYGASDVAPSPNTSR